MFLNISKGCAKNGDSHQIRFIFMGTVQMFVFFSTARRSEIKYDRVRAKKIMRQREPRQVADREKGERERSVSGSCL